MIRLIPNFDAILIDDSYIILDISKIENNKCFQSVVTTMAIQRIDAITRFNLITNSHIINDLINSEFTFAKKFLKTIRKSRVIEHGS